MNSTTGYYYVYATRMRCRNIDSMTLSKESWPTAESGRLLRLDVPPTHQTSHVEIDVCAAPSRCLRAIGGVPNPRGGADHSPCTSGCGTGPQVSHTARRTGMATEEEGRE